MTTGRNRPPVRPRRVFAAVILAGLIAAAAGFTLLACQHNTDDPAASATPQSTETQPATATPTPHPLQGFVSGEIKTVQQAPDVDFPPDTAMVVATTSDHGHGGFWRIRRVWRLGDGPVEQDDILLPLFAEGQANVTGIEAASSGRLYASVCIGDTCDFEGGPKPEVMTRFLASADGGVTWREIDRAAGEWWLGAATADRMLAARLDTAREWRIFPGGEVVAPPPVVGDLPRPVAHRDQFAWIDPNLPRLADQSGTSRLKLDLPIESRIDDAYLPLPLAFGGMFDSVFAWHAGEGSAVRAYVGRFTEGGPPHTVLDFTGVAPNPWLGGWMDQGKLVAAMDYERDAQCTTHRRTSGADPVIIDFEAATYAFIQDPFYDPYCSTGHHRIVSVMTGPLARVDTPGDCLNVREQPSLDSPVVACLPHGTLVRNEGTVWYKEWTDVIAPDGRQGWASLVYLHTAP